MTFQLEDYAQISVESREDPGQEEMKTLALLSIAHSLREIKEILLLQKGK